MTTDKHNQNDLSTEVLAKISQGNVTPRPRWYFTCKNLFLWGSGISLLIIGSLSVSIMIFIITGNGWELRQIIGTSPLEHFVEVFPVLWLLAFVVFFFAAEYIFSRTKGSYKYSALTFTLAILVASIILGTLLHFCKAAQYADQVFGKHTPQFYQTLEKRRQSTLHRPGKGRIMGVVQSVDMQGNPQTFVIIHPRKQHELTILMTELPEEKFVHIQEGKQVLIIGHPAEKGIFKAKDIHPLEKFKRKLRKMLRSDFEKKRRNPILSSVVRLGLFNVSIVGDARILF